MTVGSRFLDSSERLIKRYGTPRVYAQRSGSYDVFSQSVNSATSRSEVPMFKTEPSSRDMRSPNLVNKEAAVYLISAKALPFTPQVGDRIESVDGQMLGQVTVVKENWSQDLIVSWRLICVLS